jgi:uncharacterized protein (TIGR02001 family)
VTERRNSIRVRLPVVATAVALLIAQLPAARAHADFDARLDLISRYIYRGIDFSGQEPALQGRIEYATDLGLYAGVWASTAESSDDDRTAQVDYFAGYQQRLTPALALDATFIRYTYTGGGVGDVYDWSEAQLTAHVRDHWSITAAVADDWYGWSGTTWSMESSWYYAPAPLWMLDATLGHNAVYDAIGFDYQWAELGLTRQIGALHARVGYSATRGAADFGELTDARWIVSVGWDLRR